VRLLDEITARAALPFGRLWYGEPNAISNAIWLREVPQSLT